MAKATGKDHEDVWDGVESWTVMAGDSSAWWKLQQPNCWFVYTLHDVGLRLRVPLYVGMTSNIYTRLSQHRRQQDWWPLVGRIVVRCYADQAAAAEDEESRINHRRPLLNVAGNVHTPGREVNA